MNEIKIKGIRKLKLGRDGIDEYLEREIRKLKLSMKNKKISKCELCKRKYIEKKRGKTRIRKFCSVNCAWINLYLVKVKSKLNVHFSRLFMKTRVKEIIIITKDESGKIKEYKKEFNTKKIKLNKEELKEKE